jgi:hypothetical protein
VQQVTIENVPGVAGTTAFRRFLIDAELLGWMPSWHMVRGSSCRLASKRARVFVTLMRAPQRAALREEVTATLRRATELVGLESGLAGNETVNQACRRNRLPGVRHFLWVRRNRKAKGCFSGDRPANTVRGNTWRRDASNKRYSGQPNDDTDEPSALAAAQHLPWDKLRAITGLTDDFYLPEPQSGGSGLGWHHVCKWCASAHGRVPQFSE